MPNFLFSPVFFCTSPDFSQPQLFPLSLLSLFFTNFLSPRFSFRLVERKKKSQEDGAVKIKAKRDSIEKSRQRDRRRKWSEAGVTRK
jgi:hypothetical protein